MYDIYITTILQQRKMSYICNKTRKRLEYWGKRSTVKKGVLIFCKNMK